MYLISSEPKVEQPYLVEKTVGGFGVLKPNPRFRGSAEHPKSKLQDYEGPETEAIQGIEVLYRQFLSNQDLAEVDYLVGSSGLREQDFDYMLRDIGGATSQGREWQRRLSDEEPLLDGLAQNLIRKLFREYYGSGHYGDTVALGAKSFMRIKPGVEIRLQQMFDLLNSGDAWYRETNVPRSWWKQQTFFAQGLGKKFIELAFLAEWSTPRGRFVLQTVRTKYRSSAAYLEGATDGDFMLRSELNGIIQDHCRRTELAELYEAAPRVSGLPAPVRAGLKAGLEKIGIANGSYSRLGFSSGRFPYAQVRSRVHNWKRSDEDDSDPTLLFERCPWCGIVCRLKVEGVARLEESVAKLSSAVLEPWHSSVCEERTARFEAQIRDAPIQPLVRKLIPSAAGTGGLV